MRSPKVKSSIFAKLRWPLLAGVLLVVGVVASDLRRVWPDLEQERSAQHVLVAIRRGDQEAVREWLAYRGGPDTKVTIFSPSWHWVAHRFMWRDEPVGHYGRPLIVHAASAGDLDIVRLLLDCGADVNQSDGVGLTALAEAVRSNHMPMTRFLLDNGADPTAAYKDGSPMYPRFGGSTAAALVREAAEASTSEVAAGAPAD
jgi:hypothetical protein